VSSSRHLRDTDGRSHTKGLRPDRETVKTDAMLDLVKSVPSSQDPIDCRMVAHDLWPRRLLERREALAVTVPARVFWPRSDDEVKAVVLAARVERRPLVPFGAGSGVCGGVAPGTFAWVLDLKRLDRVLELDGERGHVVVEAGMIGERLEEFLNSRGYTLGHFPSSIYCSTVGGWVATRSAGQLSSRYGKIEDMVLAVSGVDGRGAHIHAAVDDPATGPGAVQLLVGSEGALCVITRVKLRILPLSSHRFVRGVSFPTLEQGLTAMRAILQGGHAPAVLRLYDPLDSALAGAATTSTEPLRVHAGGLARARVEDSGPHDAEEPTLFDALVRRVEELAVFSRPRATRAVVGELLGRPGIANSILDRFDGKPRLIVGLEGDADGLLQRGPRLLQLLQSHGATDLGDAPGERWLRHRHRVSYRMSKAFAVGGWVDTCEVACGWSDVAPLYRAVREALRDTAIVLCHFSHAYHDGCSLYFTFAGGGSTGTGPRGSLTRYDLCWERALTTIRRHGAVVAHHHGVGRSKLKGLRLADGNRAVLMALKRTLDPDLILNPGVLGLPDKGA
jgi:alkyldihydroxyacetonephosphate synthase